MSDAEIRMECLKLAREIKPIGGVIHPLIEAADKLAQYVLTGKKPGEA